MVQTASTEPRANRDWGVPDPGYPSKDKLALVALIVVPAVLVALVVALLSGWWWSAVVILILWGLKTFVDAKVADPIMLRRLGARALKEGEGARLRNIAAGLAHDRKVAEPRLLLLPEGGPNAWVHAGGAGGVIAVTQSLLEACTRTELEAVVAHCLTRIHAPDFLYSNLAARWSDLGAGLAPRVGLTHDVRAVALTRYPPGLVSALGKADDRVVRYAPLWFAAAAPSHGPTGDRATAISDL